jgi:formate-dependent phosphoribosylglycinamide formyltransferase (GAR transformylase)
VISDNAPHVLFLAAAHSYRVKAFADAADSLGVRCTFAIDDAPQFPCTQAQVLSIPLSPIGEGLQALRDFAAESPIDAVIGLDEDTAALAAHCAQALNLTGHSPQAVGRATNKYSLRQSIFRTAELHTPWFARVPVDSRIDVKALCPPFPCVVKPLDGTASHGVIRADDGTQLRDAFALVAGLVTASSLVPIGHPSRALLVESFIDGSEHCVDGLLSGREFSPLAVFDKMDALDGPVFEEGVLLTPTRLTCGQLEDAFSAIGCAARALGLSFGPIHAEFRINSAGVWILEVAPRSIGGRCSDALLFGPGMSLEELIVRHALGWPTHNFKQSSDVCGAMMLPIPGRGRLRRVDGLLNARAVPGIVSAEITINVGEQVVPLPEGKRYLGFMIARGKSHEEVERALRDAQTLLHFSLEPDHCPSPDS